MIRRRETSGGLLQSRGDRELHPRGLLQVGRQERAQVREQQNQSQAQVEAQKQAQAQAEEQMAKQLEAAKKQQEQFEKQATVEFGATALSALLTGPFAFAGPIYSALSGGSSEKMKAQRVWLSDISSKVQELPAEQQKEFFSSDSLIVKQYKEMKEVMTDYELQNWASAYGKTYLGSDRATQPNRQGEIDKLRNQYYKRVGTSGYEWRGYGSHDEYIAKLDQLLYPTYYEARDKFIQELGWV